MMLSLPLPHIPTHVGSPLPGKTVKRREIQTFVGTTKEGLP